MITGAPGTGKTTLIKRLEQEGYPVFHDVARMMIESGWEPPIWQKKQTTDFGRAVLENRIAQYITASSSSKCFFDRGIPDSLIFSFFMGKKPDPNLIDAIRQYRYHTLVFIAPPWQAIYLPDAVRKESFSEIVELDKITRKVYQEAGYQCIDLPETSTGLRVDFIHQVINQAD